MKAVHVVLVPLVFSPTLPSPPTSPPPSLHAVWTIPQAAPLAHVFAHVHHPHPPNDASLAQETLPQPTANQRKAGSRAARLESGAAGAEGSEARRGAGGHRVSRAAGSEGREAAVGSSGARVGAGASARATHERSVVGGVEDLLNARIGMREL